MLFMNINELIAIVKKKLLNNFVIENISIEDKSFLHKNHPGNKEGRFRQHPLAWDCPGHRSR